jgi:hypothetical protein
MFANFKAQITETALFNRITFKNQSGHGPILDIGAIAEALIFYGEVAIIANYATLKYLMCKISPLVLLELVRSKRLTLYYVGDQVAVSTTNVRGLNIHDLISFSHSSNDIDKVPGNFFFERTRNKIASMQFAKAVKPIDHVGLQKESMLDILQDHKMVETTISSIIETIAPTYTQEREIRFRINRTHDGFTVDTNLNFEALDIETRKNSHMKDSKLAEAHFVTFFQEAQETMFFAEKLNSEIAVSALNESIHDNIMSSFLERRRANQVKIDEFSSLALESAHSIRECVNNGTVPFMDIVRLLDKADNFRSWLSEKPADADVIRDYYKRTTERSWVTKLPGKTTRWAVFTGIGVAVGAVSSGVAGTAITTALSAFDTFLLDRLAEGWKPHRFVEGDLRRTLKKN